MIWWILEHPGGPCRVNPWDDSLLATGVYKVPIQLNSLLHPHCSKSWFSSLNVSSPSPLPPLILFPKQPQYYSRGVYYQNNWYFCPPPLHFAKMIFFPRVNKMLLFLLVFHLLTLIFAFCLSNPHIFSKTINNPYFRGQIEKYTPLYYREDDIASTICFFTLYSHSHATPFPSSQLYILPQ